MSDPVVQILAKDVWVKVATAILSASVYILDNNPKRYLHTYVDTGGAAPDNSSVREGMRISYEDAPQESPPYGYEGFGFTASADLYIMAVGANGEVRTDA